jgi:outer membrane protein assembly factor BamB
MERRHNAPFLLVAATALSMVGTAWSIDGGADNWAQWRGPLHTGEAPRGNPPLEWSEGKNVRWKVEVPGLGKGTPVVWNDLVFVTTAVPTGGPRPRSGRSSGWTRGHKAGEPRIRRAGP